jgi:hypothetical protein
MTSEPIGVRRKSNPSNVPERIPEMVSILENYYRILYPVQGCRNANFTNQPAD